MAVLPDHNWITIEEAARILDTCPEAILSMAKDGVLPIYSNPQNEHEMLIDRNDLAGLPLSAVPRHRFPSDGIDKEPVDIPASQIKAWIRESWHRNR